MDNRPPIDAGALRDTLGERWRVEVVARSESTNAELSADAEAPDRSLLVAELQTAGRGRLDRSWSSPEGAGLTFSVLFRPDVPAARWGWLPLLAGVALHAAVRPHAAVTLKWPNDLLATDGGKLAGVLVQTAGSAAVVGIGLNVSTTADELAVPTATSLALQGAAADRTALLAEIVGALDHWYTAWAGAGGDADASGLAAAYRAACGTLGTDVRVATPSGPVSGTALDIDETGQLVLDTSSGTRHIAAGDVTQVRADGGQTAP